MYIDYDFFFEPPRADFFLPSDLRLGELTRSSGLKCRSNGLPFVFRLLGALELLFEGILLGASSIFGFLISECASTCSTIA